MTLKQFIIFILLIFFTQGCSTTVTVVDEAISTSSKVITGAVKGAVHITTCPFTKKKCF